MKNRKTFTRSYIYIRTAKFQYAQIHRRYIEVGFFFHFGFTVTPPLPSPSPSTRFIIYKSNNESPISMFIRSSLSEMYFMSVCVCRFVTC